MVFETLEPINRIEKGESSITKDAEINAVTGFMERLVMIVATTLQPSSNPFT